MLQLLVALFDNTVDLSLEVSVLMLVYNQDLSVAKAVLSVIGQIDTRADITISAEGSKDATREPVTEVILPYSGPHRVLDFKARRRLFMDRARNLAALASCPFVVIAHDDHISAPSRAAKFLQAHRQTGADLAVHDNCTKNDDYELLFDLPPACGAWLTLDDGCFYRKSHVSGCNVAPDPRLFDLPRSQLAGIETLSGYLFLVLPAAILSGIWCESQSLVARKIRCRLWGGGCNHYRLIETVCAGASIRWLTGKRRGYQDLDYERADALIAPEKADTLKRSLDEAHAQLLTKMLDCCDLLWRRRLYPRWAAMPKITLANQIGPLIKLRCILLNRQGLSADEIDLDNTGLNHGYGSPIIPGSYPVEGAIGDRQLWVGPQSHICLFKGEGQVVIIAGCIHYPHHPEAQNQTFVRLRQGGSCGLNGLSSARVKPAYPF